MKTLYKTVAMALGAMLMLAGCGNAGAQSNTKKEKKAEESKTKAVKELNYAEFNSKVSNIKADDFIFLGDKPAIVDFTATWCGPCRMIAPILEELATEYADKIVIYKIDVDKEREIAEAFKVSSIPAILYIPGGTKEPVMTIGARGKDKFRQEIQTFLLDN